ncbi:sulfite oxidase [Cordyceps javanica]|uniref:Nitrate reductase [NADPH] n=1 Tax=Cordyceps javanica TaxID=43265 RepID=A0A545W2X5_9HYPO|nr:sulfite oxidase [Cordyceps javanica]TQW08276.1 sulfite oxidase [Cordyceps javanica]
MAAPTYNRCSQRLLLHLCARPQLAQQPLQRCQIRDIHKSASRLSNHASTEQAIKARHRAAIVLAAGLASVAVGTYFAPKVSFDSSTAVISKFKPSIETLPQKPEPEFIDTREASLPRYRLSEVKQHDGKSERPWVIHGDKVYDITEWISAHPGGSVILRAAGGSIEPYWNIFAIHKNQYVYDILQQYLIGFVHPADLQDGKPPQDAIEDPFADDPIRHPDLITKTVKPRNAETPGEAMSAQFLTPNDLFYVRNHMWVPRIAEDESDDHLLSIELLDGSVKEYTLRDLKAKFPKHEVTAVLQCSGNRRKHMSEGSGRATNGLQWTAGAISNACWEGVLLADVLKDAGFENHEGMSGTSEVKHVQFNGMEAYGASIPIRKAVDPQGDVLLAYGMNGKPLPRDHGYPLRAIVPGHVAARSVKWLNQITLSEDESMSQWQRKDYKCFGPNQTKVDWDKAPAIQELPVQSAITSLKLGDWVKKPATATSGADAASDPDETATTDARKLTLSGYAFSGGGRSIIRVDISVDSGKNWTQAYLLPDCDPKPGSPSLCHGHGAWTWKRWMYKGAIPASVFQQGEPEMVVDDDSVDNQTPTAGTAPGSRETGRRCTTLLVKATDEVYNCQPESHAATWNFRGNLANAWHRVQVCSECAPDKKNQSEETMDTKKD